MEVHRCIRRVCCARAWLLMKGAETSTRVVKARSAGPPAQREGEQVSNGVRTVKQKAGISGGFYCRRTRCCVGGGGGRSALSGGERDLEAQPHADQFNDITRHQIAVAGERVTIDVGGCDTALAQLPPRRAGTDQFDHLFAFLAQRD